VATIAVLVNGLPGSGKTSLAHQLSAHLRIPLLSKDTIKESLANLTAGTVASSRLGSVAMETIWALAAEMPGALLVESWWFRPRDLDFALAGVQTAGIKTVIEVWCDVPPDLARRRILARHRLAINRDELRLNEAWDEWCREAGPLGIGPVVVVDTTQPVDLADALARVAEHVPPIQPEEEPAEYPQEISEMFTSTNTGTQSEAATDVTAAPAGPAAEIPELVSPGASAAVSDTRPEAAAMDTTPETATD